MVLQPCLSPSLSIKLPVSPPEAIPACDLICSHDSPVASHLFSGSISLLAAPASLRALARLQLPLPPDEASVQARLTYCWVCQPSSKEISSELPKVFCFENTSFCFCCTPVGSVSSSLWAADLYRSSLWVFECSWMIAQPSDINIVDLYCPVL